MADYLKTVPMVFSAIYNLDGVIGYFSATNQVLKYGLVRSNSKYDCDLAGLYSPCAQAAGNVSSPVPTVASNNFSLSSYYSVGNFYYYFTFSQGLSSNYSWFDTVTPMNSLNELLAAMNDGDWNIPSPPSVSVPITYYPTGCVLQGPSEAEQGDTVNVLVTPGPGKIIKPESIQVYDRSGLITHTYASGILSFDVPAPE